MDLRAYVLRNDCWEDLPSMVFPPQLVMWRGQREIKAFLLAHHHPLKMLLLILAARRRRVRHPPAELWVLIRDEYFW